MSIIEYYGAAHLPLHSHYTNRVAAWWVAPAFTATLSIRKSHLAAPRADAASKSRPKVPRLVPKGPGAAKPPRSPHLY